MHSFYVSTKLQLTGFDFPPRTSSVCVVKSTLSSCPASAATTATLHKLAAIMKDSFIVHFNVLYNDLIATNGLRVMDQLDDVQSCDMSISHAWRRTITFGFFKSFPRKVSRNGDGVWRVSEYQ